MVSGGCAVSGGLSAWILLPHGILWSSVHGFCGTTVVGIVMLQYCKEKNTSLFILPPCCHNPSHTSITTITSNCEILINFIALFTH